MKTIIILIILICEFDVSDKEKLFKEDFFQFLEDFSYDHEFQIRRIKFPLVIISLDESFTQSDTTYLKQQEYKPNYFLFVPGNESYHQVYDNFNHELQDTNERVLAWHGIGNGIRIFYYFKRIEGLWFLIKKEDFST
jgi:hypothetical protein